MDTTTKYRLDWGVLACEYKITKNRPIWVERLDFTQGENIYTEDYQEISYKKYRKLMGKGQILRNY